MTRLFATLPQHFAALAPVTSAQHMVGFVSKFTNSFIDQQ